MIHLDGITWSVQKMGGIWTYFGTLIDRLEAEGLAYVHLTHERDKGRPGEYRAPRPLERFRTAPVPDGARVFMSSYYRRPARAVPSVVTVHDFVYEAMLSGFKTRVHAWQKHAAIRAAADIICVSEATKADLLKYVGKPAGRIHVIHNGVSDRFTQVRPASEHDGYVIYVGHRHRYKNFGLLLEALAHLPALDLVVVGDEPWTDDERARTAASVRGKLTIEQGIEVGRLNVLMNGAVALAYPSLYEGFGIPVIEAMRAGCPAVAVDCAAVREAGGAGLLVAETGGGAAFAAQIARAMGPERAEIVARGIEHAAGFGWDRTHARTADVLRRHL